EQRCEVEGLRWDALPQRLENLGRRSLSAERWSSARVRLTRLGEEHGADLVDGEVDEPARQVAPGRLDESGQKGGAQERHLTVERIGEPQLGHVPGLGRTKGVVAL